MCKCQPARFRQVLIANVTTKVSGRVSVPLDRVLSDVVRRIGPPSTGKWCPRGYSRRPQLGHLSGVSRLGHRPQAKLYCEPNQR